MSSPSLLNGALLNASARVLTLALGLAVLVVVARLGPQVQGAFAIFVALESLLLALSAGLGLVLARAVSHHGAAPAPLVRTGLRAASLGGLAAGALLLAGSALSHAEPYRHLWLLALAAPVLLWVPTASGLWLGQGRLLALNAPAVAAPALVLGLVMLSPAQPTVLAVLTAWVAAKMAVAALTGVVALRGSASAAAAGAGASAPSFWRQHGRFVVLVALANGISLLNLRATLFLIERVQGLAAAGVYSVAVHLAELLWVLSSAFTVAAYHRIGGRDVEAAARLTLQALRAGVGLALAVALPLAVLAWWALPAALGPAYADARLPLLLLLPGVALYAAASSLSAFHTNLHGRPQWAARVGGLSLALTLVGAALAVPWWGAAGAAAATSLAYTVAIGLGTRDFLRTQGWGWGALWRGAPALPAGSDRGSQSTTA
jgi:O-antigen/teichoic acid export membrane protein